MIVPRIDLRLSLNLTAERLSLFPHPSPSSLPILFLLDVLIRDTWIVTSCYGNQLCILQLIQAFCDPVAHNPGSSCIIAERTAWHRRGRHAACGFQQRLCASLHCSYAGGGALTPCNVGAVSAWYGVSACFLNNTLPPSYGVLLRCRT